MEWLFCAILCAMATVFKRKNSDIWTAAFRAWDAGKGKWIWKQQSTGAADESAAAGIAAKLEQASAAAKAGTLTRARAFEMVNEILRLAGSESIQPAPSLSTVAADLLASLSIADVTRRKYESQRTKLVEWAGKRAGEPITSFTVADMQDFYTDVRKRFSGTTAYDHLNFASMVFNRAMAHGHCTANPTKAVKRGATGAVEKLTFSRSEQAAILRAVRKQAKPKIRQAWQCFVSLGWHTGHRIQDLLDVTAASIEGDLLTMQPRKKATRGGRTVVLPLPRWLAAMVTALGDFKALNHADNRNGRVSEDFVQWLVKAGIDPQPVERGERVVHLKSFHSYRHSMQTRLTSAGVSGELARLVTDHDSVKVARKYVHAEIQGLREALGKARSRR